MAVLIKTAPIVREHGVGTICAFKEPAFREPVFGRGEKAFIWTDGAGKGGKDSRLYAEGMVVEEPSFDASARSGTPVRVKVVLTKIEPEKPLRYSEDIFPHRDNPANRILHNLADVICRDSHKKVTVLGREEAMFLGSRFD